MNRRRLLQVAAAGAIISRPSSQAAGKEVLELHTDLMVIKGHEQVLLDDFEKHFLPAIRKAPGFIETRLLEFRTTGGSKEAPLGMPFRMIQVFESWEHRQQWEKMPVKPQVWVM